MARWRRIGNRRLRMACHCRCIPAARRRKSASAAIATEGWHFRLNERPSSRCVRALEHLQPQHSRGPWCEQSHRHSGHFASTVAVPRTGVKQSVPSQLCAHGEQQQQPTIKWITVIAKIKMRHNVLIRNFSLSDCPRPRFGIFKRNDEAANKPIIVILCGML